MNKLTGSQAGGIREIVDALERQIERSELLEGLLRQSEARIDELLKDNARQRERRKSDPEDLAAFIERVDPDRTASTAQLAGAILKWLEG